MVIAGPTTIHAFDGTAEMANEMGVGWVGRWGINIPTGTTVQVPQSITLLNGDTYVPDGYVDFYESDARMEAAQKCWLLNHP